MSEALPNPQSLDANHRSLSRTRAVGPLSRLRWFAAEFAVVMIGVLAALAVQSWYQGRSDRAKERAYLEQLTSELKVGIDQLERALVVQRGSERAAVDLQRAVLSRSRPSEDSLATLAIDLNYYSDPSASIGTARALLTTGDILLLRDAKTRAAVVDVVERTAYAESQLQIWQRYFLDAIDRLDSVLSNTGLIARHGFTVRLDSLTASRDWLPEADDRRPVTGASVTAVLDDRNFQHILRAVRLAAANLRSIQEDQLKALHSAQEVVARTAQR